MRHVGTYIRRRAAAVLTALAIVGVATILGRLGGAARALKDYATSVARYREELLVRNHLIAVAGPLPARVSEQSWCRLRLAEALLENASSAPPSARVKMIAEARGLVLTTGRDDGKIAVTAGSPPGFVELYDLLTARLAAF